MLSSGLMAGAVEAFRRRAGGWPGGLSEGRECRALAADSPYRFRVGGSAVRLPQRSLRSEDNRTAEAALPLGKAPDGLPGGGLRAFFRREAPGFGLWGWDVWWRRGPVPEGGRYGKGQGGGFLSSERP